MKPRQVIHTFDEESPYEDLRGKEAEFTIAVQSVKEMHLPELNDEFAQTLGEFENLEDLRKAIRTQLEQNYLAAVRPELLRRADWNAG